MLKNKKLLTFQGHILGISLFLLQMVGTPIHFGVSEPTHTGSDTLLYITFLLCFIEWNRLW